MKISSKTFSLISDENVCNVGFSIPVDYAGPAHDNGERMRKVLSAYKGLMLDCLGSRMQACMAKLMAHIGSAKFCGDHSIMWQRKDGVWDHFNPYSYKIMEELKADMEFDGHALERATPDKLMQLIKSLLNMPELSHEDKDGCRFSELVSILMEMLEGATVRMYR